VVARFGPPVIIGVGEGETFVASDVPGVLHHTRNIYFLADGDMAILTLAGVELTDFDGNPIERAITRILWDPVQAEKGGYKHFMLKEIWEQPRAITDTTRGRVSLDSGKVFLGEMKIGDEELAAATSLSIAACGTSWHAALTGKYMIERLARLPVDVDYASEYRYRNPIAADYAIRRDRRHPCGSARDEGARLKDRGHLQCGGRHGGPRGAWRHLHPCGAGDRRRLDQGLHRPAYRVVFAGSQAGPTARPSRCCTVGRPDRRVEPHSSQNRGGVAFPLGAV
jgi:hypothetical protein